ncbi:MAG: hypothetical protein PHR83_16200 [Paludibacter sp.]|nr:hypothetical protein [Paludibacter sp.]
MFRKVFKVRIFVCLFIPVFTGCASMSTMQTARVTEKGKFDYLVGGGVVNSSIVGTSRIVTSPDTVSTTTVFSQKFYIPFIELGMRYGILDNLDVGAKVSIIGTATLDFKYQFLGDRNSKLAGSVGLGGGYISIGVNTTKNHMYDAMLPVYFSYHPLNWISLYCSPKYVFRTTNSYNFENNYHGTTFSHWYGASGGIRIGKRIAFLAEYSFFGNSLSPVPFSQVSCGIAFQAD